MQRGGVVAYPLVVVGGAGTLGVPDAGEDGRRGGQRRTGRRVAGGGCLDDLGDRRAGAYRHQVTVGQFPDHAAQPLPDRLVVASFGGQSVGQRDMVRRWSGRLRRLQVDGRVGVGPARPGCPSGTSAPTQPGEPARSGKPAWHPGGVGVPAGGGQHRGEHQQQRDQGQRNVITERGRGLGPPAGEAHLPTANRVLCGASTGARERWMSSPSVRIRVSRCRTASRQASPA